MLYNIILIFLIIMFLLAVIYYQRTLILWMRHERDKARDEVVKLNFALSEMEAEFRTPNQVKK